jgi:hypothetical protein
MAQVRCGFRAQDASHHGFPTVLPRALVLCGELQAACRGFRRKLGKVRDDFFAQGTAYCGCGQDFQRDMRIAFNTIFKGYSLQRIQQEVIWVKVREKRIGHEPGAKCAGLCQVSVAVSFAENESSENYFGAEISTKTSSKI